MNIVSQQHHRDIDTAADMLYNLHELFGGQGRQARQQAVRQFMNCRMKAGTLVRDHMMLIISYLNEMEILGSEINGETKIDMILETLPRIFRYLQAELLHEQARVHCYRAYEGASHR